MVQIEATINSDDGGSGSGQYLLYGYIYKTLSDAYHAGRTLTPFQASMAMVMGAVFLTALWVFELESVFSEVGHWIASVSGCVARAVRRCRGSPEPGAEKARRGRKRPRKSRRAYDSGKENSSDDEEEEDNDDGTERNELGTTDPADGDPDAFRSSQVRNRGLGRAVMRRNGE